MNTIKTAAAAVTGARHVRAGRNGQDAAVALVRDDIAVAVVCDGCSSGASSEVGARLGAEVFARAVLARVSGAEAVERSDDEVVALPCAGLEREQRTFGLDVFEAARADLARVLTGVLEHMPGDREARIHDLFLFTIVAAVLTRDGAAVWALGDGAYAFDDHVVELGPFSDNAPPYLAYDLLDDPRDATFATAQTERVVIATDGAADLGTSLERFRDDRFVTHPDALRRELSLLARSSERIDWDARRVERTPAALQDDCAVAVLRRLS